jgi:hypothetical protein
MIRTIPLCAVLALTLTACADDGGPFDAPAPRSFEEVFSLALPEFRPLTAPVRAVAEPAAATTAANYSYDSSEIPPAFQALMAEGWLITQPSKADAGFHPEEGVAFGTAYGRSKGNYYQNLVTVTLRRNGSNVATITGETSEWSGLHLPVGSWGEPATAHIGAREDCGNEVFASSRHEAELRLLPAFKLFALMAEVGTDSDGDAQPACRNGGNGAGADESWYICYWEDVYDGYGEFIRRDDLGCIPLNVNMS